MKKIYILSNTAWSVYNFRRNLIVELINAKYDVTIISNSDKYSANLKKLGCRFVKINFDTKTKNVFKNLNFNIQLFRILKNKPNLLINITIKPIIFGGLCSSFLNIKNINIFDGLGRLFQKKNFFYYMGIFLLKFSSLRTMKVFISNKDDKLFLLKNKIYNKQKIVFLRGTGINLDYFKFYPLKKNSKNIFLYVGRIIPEKGILIFLEAAKKIKLLKKNIHFHVLGSYENSSPINKYNLEKKYKRYVKFLGFKKDIRNYYRKSLCTVLPTNYNEGLNRSLMESLATGRPIITTKMQGCKELILNNKTGYIIKNNDTSDLANKIIKMAFLSYKKKKNISSYSRDLIKGSYDEKQINKKILKLLNVIKI